MISDSLDKVSVWYLHAKQKCCNKATKQDKTLIVLPKSDMVKMITRVSWEN